MASLIKRGDFYHLQWYQGEKKRRKSLRTDSLQIAKQKLRQFESAQFQGHDCPLPTRTPIGEVVAAFVEHMKAHRPERSWRRDVSRISASCSASAARSSSSAARSRGSVTGCACPRTIARCSGLSCPPASRRSRPARYQSSSRHALAVEDAGQSGDPDQFGPDRSSEALSAGEVGSHEVPSVAGGDLVASRRHRGGPTERQLGNGVGLGLLGLRAHTREPTCSARGQSVEDFDANGELAGDSRGALRVVDSRVDIGG